MKLVDSLLIRLLKRKRLNAISRDYSRNSLSRNIYRQYLGIVQHGLFKGLQVGELGFWDGGGDAGAKILGIYEQQILGELQKIEKFKTLVNIGAADGYYGFGLIFANKCERAIFFESEIKSRAEIEKMNQKYNFDIEIRAAASRENLKALIEGLSMRDSLFLIDIEGAEFNIFDRELINHMNGCTAILEVHDFLDPEYDKKILEAKFASHFIVKKIYIYL